MSSHTVLILHTSWSPRANFSLKSVPNLSPETHLFWVVWTWIPHGLSGWVLLSMIQNLKHHSVALFHWLQSNLAIQKQFTIFIHGKLIFSLIMLQFPGKFWWKVQKKLSSFELFRNLKSEIPDLRLNLTGFFPAE